MVFRREPHLVLGPNALSGRAAAGDAESEVILSALAPLKVPVVVELVTSRSCVIQTIPRGGCTRLVTSLRLDRSTDSLVDILIADDPVHSTKIRARDLRDAAGPPAVEQPSSGLMVARRGNRVTGECHVEVPLRWDLGHATMRLEQNGRSRWCGRATVIRRSRPTSPTARARISASFPVVGWRAEGGVDDGLDLLEEAEWRLVAAHPGEEDVVLTMESRREGPALVLSGDVIVLGPPRSRAGTQGTRRES